MSGYIYCFSNLSMHDILKVGMTERTPEIRLIEANNSDTWRPPTPYKIVFAKKVLNPKQKETMLHTLLSQSTERINPRREFFRVSKEEVKNFFDQIDGEYVETSEEEEEQFTHEEDDTDEEEEAKNEVVVVEQEEEETEEERELMEKIAEGKRKTEELEIKIMKLKMKKQMQPIRDEFKKGIEFTRDEHLKEIERNKKEIEKIMGYIANHEAGILGGRI